MPRKVYDIRPPQYHCPEPAKGCSCWNSSKLTLPIVIFILFVLIGGYFLLNKAEVTVVSEIEKIVLDSEESVNWDGPPLGSVETKIFEFSREEKAVFQATGEVKEENRATGTIRVYNNFSTSPQILIANTRFLSASNHLFRIAERVSVPGYRHEGGKVIPGHLDITVVAAEPGEDYNIQPTKFSLPGLSGTAQYTKVYAESTEPMTGGSLATVTVVSSSDLEKAETELLRKLRDSEDAFLVESLDKDWISLQDGVRRQIGEGQSSALAKDVTDSFEYSVKMEIEVAAVNKNEVMEWIKKETLAKVTNRDREAIFVGPEVDLDTLEMEISLAQTNWNQGTGKIRIDGSVDTYIEVDSQRLSSFLSGKNKQKMVTELESYPEIKKVEIKSRAFWTSLLPANSSRISVKRVSGI